ncbi:helix-turn-helix domain-containing protein [Streptococcus massiliensis]|uniref:Transcriptional activator n=1 Tax=Streptococcus massiliensis TaxID=313439 RepID=A0A380L0R0_9STRE|nr:Rgg/GadR/MutR family transcriptional regulator [Streptococcus massiliensis]SUN72160.1 transcriptional activator [Streptococcus massiliensis]SUN76977.1 transcriptional activator [Streptococcus massiliensis]
MKHLGPVFKKLREARHISLAEAVGDEFSPSMLSKFESGKSELSAQKLFVALGNTHTEVSEYLYLVRGFNRSKTEKLQEKIHDLEVKQDYEGLQKLYSLELAEFHRQHKSFHMVNALTIKAHLKGLGLETNLTAEEETFLYNYLFETEIWGRHELTLFSVCSTLLSPELFTRYTREMLQKTDDLNVLTENKTAVKTMFLNGFLLCIEEKDFVNATYFDKQIQDNFYQENETYYRIIYMWAKGYLAYRQNQKEKGLKQMEKAVSILETLDCRQAASYYRDAMNRITNETSY